MVFARDCPTENIIHRDTSPCQIIRNAAQFFILNDIFSPVWDTYTDGNSNTLCPLGNPLQNPLFIQRLPMNSSDNISSMFDSCKWPIIKDLFNNIIAHVGLEFGHTNLLTIRGLSITSKILLSPKLVTYLWKSVLLIYSLTQ
jgi:beta-xylosidase